MKFSYRLGSAMGVAVVLAGICAVLGAAPAAAKRSRASAAIEPFAIAAPRSAVVSHQDAFTYCTFPDGTFQDFFHCYTPQDIRSAYGVDSVAPIGQDPNYGQGQTVVLVDSYGSPTVASDLQHFHDTFFPNLPNPNFQQIFPNGNPQFHNTCTSSKGQSGPCSAANWSGEAELDAEWSYAIAPEAHIIMLAVPPAETEGATGFPNLFKAISAEISATPSGTLFSMSFGITEQTFGGAAAAQVAKYDQVFKQGIAKDDNFFAATGDYGTADFLKQAKDSTLSTTPVVGWPASSPYVVAVGGTQLQYGWTWDPSSDDAFDSSGNFNPAYWNATSSGDSQAVWNESWASPPIASNGGASIIYARPSWQASVDPGYGDHRLLPDTAWNAAVNGGVEVYITAYPEFNCGNSTGCWTFFGGTSAASPQTAGLVALANAARAADGKQPIGFLDPILYNGVGQNDYTDIVPQHYGSAPQTFAGSEVGVSGPVEKSVGDLVDNQPWDSSVPGYATTIGYDATTGWGTPNAPAFVAALAGMS